MESNTLPRTPLKAIRQHCIECSGGNKLEVSKCPVTECSLYAFRRGKNPYRTARTLSEEQRNAHIECLRRWREQQADAPQDIKEVCSE